jgi:hypothetical protein
MFLAAALAGPGYSVPVKIRNMSATGALVEAGSVPERGAAVQLVRGRLRASAEVAWCVAGKCGLRFSGLVNVKEWLAPAANQEQHRIDEAVRLLKAGAVPLGAASQSRETVSSAELASDLDSVRRLLDAHCDCIAGDAAYVAQFGEQLQNLDIALQVVAAVADLLICGPDDQLQTASRLKSLRASCFQALRTTRSGNS